MSVCTISYQLLHISWCRAHTCTHKQRSIMCTTSKYKWCVQQYLHTYYNRHRIPFLTTHIDKDKYCEHIWTPPPATQVRPHPTRVCPLLPNPGVPSRFQSGAAPLPARESSHWFDWSCRVRVAAWVTDWSKLPCYKNMWCLLWVLLLLLLLVVVVEVVVAEVVVVVVVAVVV